MNANELRIGNKLLINGLHGENVIMTLASITSKGSLNDDHRVLYFEEDNEQFGEFLCHCSGIPITEQWLLQHGFDHWGIECLQYEKRTIYALFNFIDGSSTFKIVLIDSFYNDKAYKEWVVLVDYDKIYVHRMDFIHDLQNVFFILTRQEL